MASDPDLVARLTAVLARFSGVVPRQMFGGTCFTLNGHMCVGVHNANLILRVGVARADALMATPGVRPMDVTGRPMKGWATVLPTAIADDPALARFAAMAVDFVATLPPKPAKAKPRRR